jgi:hypothetical protein
MGPCKISLIGLFFSVSLSKHVIFLTFEFGGNVKDNFSGKEYEQDYLRRRSCNMWEG